MARRFYIRSINLIIKMMPEISSRITPKMFSKKNWCGQIQNVLPRLFFILNGLRYSVVELLPVIPTSENGSTDCESIGKVELSLSA